MIGYRLAARRNLPLGSEQSGRLLSLMVALLVYVAALCGIGLIVLDDASRAAEHALAGTLTLQVPAEASNARLETVLALVRKTPGIVSVHLFEPAETARLIQPWLGPVPLDELPVPRLIDLRVDPNGTSDLAALRRQLASVVPDSRLDDHRTRLQGTHAVARRIEAILAAGVAIALWLIAAAAVLAFRAGLRIEQSVTGLLYVLGAADADIAGAFAARSLRLGLLGGVVGAIAAFFTILALDDVGSIVQLPAPITVNGIADWRVWGVLAGTALVAGLIAMAGTWAAVRRRLAAMP